MKTGEQIRDGMNPGQRYRSVQLRNRFGVSTATLNIMVGSGFFQTERVGGMLMYFVPAPQRQFVMTSTKPMKLSREMLAAADRVGELRLHPSKY